MMKGPSRAVVVVLLVFLLPTASGSTIQGRVLNARTGTGIADARLELYSLDNRSLANATTDESGAYHFADVPAGSYRLRVAASGYVPTNLTISVGDNATATRDVSLHPPASAPFALGAPIFPVVLLVVTALLIGGLFARIQRSQMLQNAVRLRIYEHIQSHPGDHYRSILSTLGLAMGVLSHHLNTLERGAYVMSRQDGVYRRFYPAGTKTEITFFLSDVQKRIVLALMHNAGISQAKLAASVGISRPLAHYHLRILRDAGLVRLEHRGRETECYLVERTGTSP